MRRGITVKRVVLVSFLVDLLDVGLNFVVMFLTGSVVLAAELTQGATDLFASGLLLIGLKRPEKEIRFWTLLSSLAMLFFASSFSFYFGWQRFNDPQEIRNLPVAYAALIISIVSNGYALLLSIRQMVGVHSNFRTVLREFFRSHLVMTKNAVVLDLMGTSSALVGLVSLVLYQLTGELRFDGVGAMAIGVVLAGLSLRLTREILRKNERS